MALNGRRELFEGTFLNAEGLAFNGASRGVTTEHAQFNHRVLDKLILFCHIVLFFSSCFSLSRLRVLHLIGQFLSLFTDGLQLISGQRAPIRPDAGVFDRRCHIHRNTLLLVADWTNKHLIIIVFTCGAGR